MNLINYRILISNLPVRLQSLTTKRTTWLKAENEIFWLKNVNDNLFGDKKTFTVCRNDIFLTMNLRYKIIKTIYRGYPRGMRGNNLVNILKQIDLIENSLNKLIEIDKPTSDHFNELTISFKEIKGLGISTLRKFLYFLQLSFNSNSCIILDQRLIDVFASKTYSEFQQLKEITYDNSEKKYLNFLLLINQVSEKLEIKGENIEQFLFMFGNNLKSIE
ncbi:MAG: hypothetical protein H7250_12905 [Flavobacterium sp.]|nr:hypothetical protein [Flavobacterium sp.]